MSDGAPASPSRRALRLTFAYEADLIELISRQEVDMTLPPSHPLSGYEGQAGFWFELRDKDGQPVYRRTMHSPIRFDTEVFSPEPDTLRRLPLDRPRGHFVLLVPDIEQARTLALFSRPLRPQAHHLAAQEVARFDLATGMQKGKQGR